MQWLHRIQRYFRAMVTGTMPQTQTRLQQAAFTGDIHSVRELLDLGADINEGEDDMTPLRLAIYGGRTDMVRLLLERGANTSGRGIQNALAWADKTGRIDIVSLVQTKQSDHK